MGDKSRRAFPHPKSCHLGWDLRAASSHVQMQMSGPRPGAKEAVVFPRGLCFPKEQASPLDQAIFQSSSTMLSHKGFHHSSPFLGGRSKLPADSVRWGQTQRSRQEDKGGEESASGIRSRWDQWAGAGVLWEMRTKTGRRVGGQDHRPASQGAQGDSRTVGEGERSLP